MQGVGHTAVARAFPVERIWHVDAMEVPTVHQEQAMRG